MGYAAGVLVALLVLLMAACSRMPEIRHDVGLKRQPAEEVCCRKDCLPFVQTSYRLIHAIEASLPDGTAASLLGVVLVDPVGNSLHCVLMTPEGFVLLDAVDDKGISIRRGVPPFDSPAFTEGMIADIRLMLLPPRGLFRDAGREKNGSLICRYSDSEGRITDVTAGGGGDDCREIRQYDASGSLRRAIRLFQPGEPGIFGKIELDAPGIMGYSLRMTLIEGEPLK